MPKNVTHMQSFQERNRTLFDELAARYNFTPAGVSEMYRSVLAGNGRMAQFDHPDFGGGGQWMRGGMTMIARMADASLKARVAGLCSDLAEALADDRTPSTTGSAEPVAPVPEDGRSGDTVDTKQQWWPPDLGAPNTAGAQNDVRYAYFAAARRLAIDEGGRVTLYDTLDHQITGVAQSQSNQSSLTFSTGQGAVDLTALPDVSDAPSRPQRQTREDKEPVTTDPFSAIEKLALLHANGNLSNAEYSEKKAELLRRI